MFENLKGMAGMAGLLRDLPKIKARMQEVKEKLGRITVDAETGAVIEAQELEEAAV